MQKLIFLDFDGVLNNRMYNFYRNIHHLPEKDELGVLFNPDCAANAPYPLRSSWQLCRLVYGILSPLPPFPSSLPSIYAK